MDALAALLPSSYRPEIVWGQEGYAALAALDDVDMVLSAQVGAARPARHRGRRRGRQDHLPRQQGIAGARGRSHPQHLPPHRRGHPSRGFEHFALFEGMVGRGENDIARLVLTASGGPFRTKDAAFLKNVRPEDALKHPNWSMGAKITIDSATLMNKGLEIIEACHLYHMPARDVVVVVHPQSIVHSLVELADGALMGHFAVPDMRVPIADCLSWPYLPDGRVTGIRPLDLAKIGTLTFEEPRLDLFPCLDLARRALAQGHTVELNAANEVAVARFLAGDIGFTDIPALVRDMLDDASDRQNFDLDDGPLAPQAARAVEAVEQTDNATRRKAEAWRP